MKNSTILFLVLLAGAIFSCSKTPTPKPKGYYRIALLDKNYQNYTSNCGLSFETPEYSKIEIPNGTGIDSCWINIAYPKYKAKLHLTYLLVDGPIEGYLEDAFKFAYKHEEKASAINSTKIEVKENSVNGLVYDIKGNVATSLQFFATDSTDHFLRGSLYFMNRPNEDSIAPVLSHLRKDLFQMIETLKWPEDEQ